jgi:hypothetical protein
VKDSSAAMRAGLEMRAGTPRPRGLISADNDAAYILRSAGIERGARGKGGPRGYR